MAVVPSTDAKNQQQNDEQYQHCRSSFLLNLKHGRSGLRRELPLEAARPRAPRPPFSLEANGPERSRRYSVSFIGAPQQRPAVDDVFPHFVHLYCVSRSPPSRIERMPTRRHPNSPSGMPSIGHWSHKATTSLGSVVPHSVPAPCPSCPASLVAVIVVETVSKRSGFPPESSLGRSCQLDLLLDSE